MRAGIVIVQCEIRKLIPECVLFSPAQMHGTILVARFLSTDGIVTCATSAFNRF